MGLGTKYLKFIPRDLAALGVNLNSLFYSTEIRANSWEIPSASELRRSIPHQRMDLSVIQIHSAATRRDARIGVVVTDCMKSLMRGTISDLKREPLNTP
jgi:hypothetical protein